MRLFVTKLIVLSCFLERDALSLRRKLRDNLEQKMVKKKSTFKRIDKNTGLESEISTATAAEPIKDRSVIEGIKTALQKR